METSQSKCLLKTFYHLNYFKNLPTLSKFYHSKNNRKNTTTKGMVELITWSLDARTPLKTKNFQ